MDERDHAPLATERYLVMTNDRRRTRWWTAARAAQEPAPEPLAALIRDPNVVIDLDRDELRAAVSWVKALFGDERPPFTVMDQEDARPQARAFVRRVARAREMVFGVWALRDLLRKLDAALEIFPDYDDNELWHCTVGGAEMGWVGKSPEHVVEVALADLVSSATRSV